MSGRMTGSGRPAAVLEEAEGLRRRFAEEVGYGRVTRAALGRLALHVMRECAEHSLAGGLRMRPSGSAYEADADGGMRSGFVRVGGAYFKDREAVSFHSDGSVGVAEWADSRNLKPFLRALSAWIDELAGAARPAGAYPPLDLNPVDGFRCPRCGFAGVVAAFGTDLDTGEPDDDEVCEYVPGRCPACGGRLSWDADEEGEANG